MRLTEHKQAKRNGDANNHIALHHQRTTSNHNIDWDTAQCLTCSANYFQQPTLESWYTNLEQTPLNGCQPIPAPYKPLIVNVNKTSKQTSNDLIWLTIHRPPTDFNKWIEADLWLMTNVTWVFNSIPSWLNWPISFNGSDHTYNIIAWQTFTWLWRWLLLRLSKYQSPTTVLFRATLTSRITLYELFFTS